LFTERPPKEGDMIVITRIAGAYLVKATPPHSDKRWTSLLPLSARRTIEGLIRHGVSLPDAFAAMLAADPHGVDHALG
jgi:hypothetical protein